MKHEYKSDIEALRKTVAELRAANKELEEFASTALTLLSVALGNHLKIYGLIGASEQGSVFLAQDLNSQRPVALKVLHSTEQDALSRFRLEAETSAALVHPNIFDIYNIELTRFPWHFTMEYVSGQSLRVYLSKHGPKPELAVSQIIANQLINALAFVHGHGLVHNNVKPENILVDYNDAGEVRKIKLTSFGQVARNGQRRPQSYFADLITTAYQEPGYLRGAVSTQASDYYSLGVILGELLTGHFPLKARQIKGLAEESEDMIITDDVPSEFAPILTRLLSHDQYSRPLQVPEIKSALSSAFEAISPLAH